MPGSPGQSPEGVAVGGLSLWTLRPQTANFFQKAQLKS